MSRAFSQTTLAFLFLCACTATACMGEQPENSDDQTHDAGLSTDAREDGSVSARDTAGFDSATSDSETSDSSNDDVTEPECFHNDFWQSLAQPDIIESPGGWEIKDKDGTGNHFYQLILAKTSPRLQEGDVIEFRDVPLEDMNNVLFMGWNCQANEPCEWSYLVRSGTLEIDTYDMTNDGQFQAQIRNVELGEVTVDRQAGTVSRVPDGQTWCIETATIRAIPVLL